ncbi:MAG TPA: GAF domain-containing protein [Deltaproteobacteria bacterium]|nr:GAF domain-containing protein [Deltaproteobacteria bacterium]
MANEKDYFTTICRVSRAFGTTLKKDDLLDLIVQSAIDTMQGKAACLFLEDEDKKNPVLVPAAQKGLSKDYLHAEPKEAKRAANEILTKGFIAIHDATKDPRIHSHEMKKAEGIASILVVPVMVEDRVIGVLGLYTADKRIFSQEEIEFLTALAEQGGMAIEHARLVEQIRKNTKLFHDLSVSMNASFDVKEIMNILTQDVARAFGVKAVSVRLLDKEKKILQLVASYGLSEKYLSKGPISAEKSIAEALQGKPIVVKDAAGDTGVQYRDEKKEEGIISILCVPIKAKEEVIGVLRLYSGVPRDFTNDEILLASAIAHQGGLAIRNASMYLMLEEDMKDLKEDIWSHRSWF